MRPLMLGRIVHGAFPSDRCTKESYAQRASGIEGKIPKILPEQPASAKTFVEFWFQIIDSEHSRRGATWNAIMGANVRLL